MSSHAHSGKKKKGGSQKQAKAPPEPPLHAGLEEERYEALLSRQEEVNQRLQAIALPAQPGPAPRATKLSSTKKGSKSSSAAAVLVPHQAPLLVKTDTHWDFVMKEMQWLSTDFTAERKRHTQSRRKLSNGVCQYFKTKETRYLASLTQAESKRRRLATRMSRNVQKWWGKMDQIVTYQQKLTYDQERHQAMNRKLVKLVQQTETYTKSLVVSNVNATTTSKSAKKKRKRGAADTNADDDDDDNEDEGGDDDEQLLQLRIEQALAVGQRRRKIHDYARLANLEDQENNSNTSDRDAAGSGALYGESTTDDAASGGSDASFELKSGESSEDDETTLEQAEMEEQMERGATLAQANRASGLGGCCFVADPVELQKLSEEATMDIDQVLERLRNEPPTLSSSQEGDDDDTEEEKTNSKRVKFSADVQVSEVPASDNNPSPKEEEEGDQKMASSSSPSSPQPSDPGEDADDDGDASDVEDFVASTASSQLASSTSLLDSGNRGDDNNNNDENDEFVDDGQAMDDETTMEEEERLPQELTAREEIDLLEQENNLSIEELRAKYAAAFAPADAGNESNQGVVEEAKTDAQAEASAENETESAEKENQDRQQQAEEGEEDVEFEPAPGDGVDDETTIEAEEKLGREMSHEEELAMLERENEIPVEKLRAMYAQMETDTASTANKSQAEDDGGEEQGGVAVGKDDADEVKDSDTHSRAEPEGTTTRRRSRRTRRKVKQPDGAAAKDTGGGGGGANDGEDDAEFEPNPEVDDETTIEAEEKLGRDMTYEEELATLNKESEIPVEQLRAMYAGLGAENEQADNPEEDADNEVSQETGNDKEDEETSTRPIHGTRSRTKRKRAEDSGASESEQAAQKAKVDGDTLSALEQSAEAAKTTLATRPFLLTNWVKLREYQQVGLNWLVSMQTRRLNGILADEMGLGKTLQTIALIAYLASYKGIWGPHLIVVPTSVIVNWETEFKRFCPGLKVLCYYGSAKRRKELRTGWTKTNWNHVVITSYQLAVQDAFAFKRKRWYYMVLDEAQNIKNFQSQRWQTLINFNTQRRLLLTGTPLQNSLMELWSLLHFLMPYIFRSRKEFSFWFENPMNDMIEGSTNENASVISRLHGIIRPFVLRRLKKDVETQMPGKYEHIVKCSLSRRQMIMYEEFMARSSTRKALRKGGNFMGMMNVLMQLRKVCNHPDLFEPRSVITPFVLDPVEMPMPACVFGLGEDASSHFDRISPSMRFPLWCGSRGEPGVENALRHDEIEAKQLQRLAHPIALPDSKEEEVMLTAEVNEELLRLETDRKRRRLQDRADRTTFLNSVNTWRCRAPSSAFPRITLDRVEFLQRDAATVRILDTPTQLLKLRKNQQKRAEECDDLIKKFVVCVPKAGLKPSTQTRRQKTDKSVEQMLLEPIEEYLRPFNRARARLSSFFPDKKLIQFDAGKLQTLAELLRELKRGGHRTLIFTQMSKMLDILEAFLNLNGHTYMRLDGSTGVDRRQRLMDRFNNDPKIFCFILSTRSGGTGVNLIGADTVVFYDSDWNPAMDAQAQDRVHRIGQTRDCHVYRLVTEHSIEENILIKAKQKKNLDILVMDRGKFDSSHLFSHDKNARLSSDSTDSQMRDVYTKGGLRAILGVVEEDEPEKSGEPSVDEDKKDLSNEQMENAMTALEDADDVEALQGAKKEAAEELQEFDECAEVKVADPDGAEAAATTDAKKRENEADAKGSEESEKKELEKEFESWQTKVGMDKESIEASLSPVERYGFRFRSDLDKYISLYAVLEYKRKAEEEEEQDDEIDIDEIEREKAYEERQALADGDLLGTNPKPNELIRHRSLFLRESARLKAVKKKRTLTGENWETRVDARYKVKFFFNVDTGEAIWDKPRVLVELEEYEAAHEKGWCALPPKPLVHVMSFLQPFPERLLGAARVCRHWHRSGTDPSFVLHVYPVEMGAYTRDDKKIDYNHFRTLHDALRAAKAGDTIELGDGHYWVNEDLDVALPIRIVGDENNPNRVVIEMSGSVINWRASGGWIEGCTFRRPKLNSSAGQPLVKSLLCILNGRLDAFQCAFDNTGSDAKAIVVSGASRKRWEGVTIKGGIDEEEGTLTVLSAG